jgi:hypothetical protein
MSGLAIALVISVESLYHDQGIPWMVTAVIGGSLVTEFLVSRTAKPELAPRMERLRTNPALAQLAPNEPIDELEREQMDELDDGDSEPHEGPIYRDELDAAPPPSKADPK